MSVAAFWRLSKIFGIKIDHLEFLHVEVMCKFKSQDRPSVQIAHNIINDIRFNGLGHLSIARGRRTLHKLYEKHFIHLCKIQCMDTLKMVSRLSHKSAIVMSSCRLK